MFPGLFKLSLVADPDKNSQELKRWELTRKIAKSIWAVHAKKEKILAKSFTLMHNESSCLYRSSQFYTSTRNFLKLEPKLIYWWFFKRENVYFFVKLRNIFLSTDSLTFILNFYSARLILQVFLYQCVLSNKCPCVTSVFSVTVMKS